MKKIIYLIILIFSCTFFSSCSTFSSSLNPQLVPRENTQIPIEGKWTVYKYAFAGMSNLTEKDANVWIGKGANFNKETIIFNDEIYKGPEFVIKIVDTKSYFLDAYKINPSAMGIIEDKVKIITVNSGNKSFREFIKLNNNHIITYKDGIFLFLKKDGTSAKDIGPATSFIPSEQDETRILHSGFLLGLRYSKKANYTIPFTSKENNIEYYYRTLWITSRDGVFDPIYEVKNILAPRRTGFWMLGVQREHDTSYTQDTIFASPIGTNFQIPTIDKNFARNEKWFNINKINFVANEYISVENKGQSSINGKNEYAMNYLNVFPLNNINSSPLKISSVLGDNSKSALFYGADVFKNSLEPNEKKMLEENPNETNWGIKRFNGNWVLTGRLGSSSQKSATMYKDFDVPFPALKKFIDYDELFPSWQIIKRKIPDAVDAYSSPNKDFVVVLSPSKLYVYTTKNHQLKDLKLTYTLNQNETPIMAQWATGIYVKNWTEIVKTMIPAK